MKIVFPVLSLETGGGARFIYHLANGLADRGHQVEIVIPDSAPLVWPMRTTVKRVAALTPASIPECDFILPNFYLTVYPAWKAEKGRVVRLSLGYEPLWVPDAEVAKDTYRIGAPILSISQWQRQIILNETGLDSTVISGGVDISVFHPYPKLSSSTGKKVIFYIMRNPNHGYTWKGGNIFLQAITNLSQHNSFDVHIVAPEGSPYNLPANCRLVSAPTDHSMAVYYAQSDIFVYTSQFEAFGLPPLEAMACGTAVITTDCGGNKDYAVNNGNCLLIPPEDINNLSSSITHLLANDSERSRLAEAGPGFAQSWTWQRTACQVEEALMRL